jgi:hypothetical protein
VGYRRNKRGNQNIPGYNENENTTYQNLWDTAKGVIRGKFIAMSAYIKKTERSKTIDLILHLKLLPKQELAEPKISRRREMILKKSKINVIETKKLYKD